MTRRPFPGFARGRSRQATLGGLLLGPQGSGPTAEPQEAATGPSGAGPTVRGARPERDRTIGLPEARCR